MDTPMSNKSAEMKDAIEKIFPGTLEAIHSGKCPTCGKEIGKFRDALSLKEYKISGTCQACQDSVFGGEDK
jgi:hydrogenase maturation factor